MSHDNRATIYIMYLDANNLYGHAMSRKLPKGEFSWMTDEEVAVVNEEVVVNMNADGEWGYVLEVDLHYPQHLHDMHNGYPLAPEGLDIRDGMLSEYAKGLKLGSTNGENMKLTPNFLDKHRYVVHLKNLQFYLQQGLELKKVRRVLKFKQEDFLGGYIHFNTTTNTFCPKPATFRVLHTIIR